MVDFWVVSYKFLVDRIIDVDQTLKEDRALFHGAQKLWLGQTKVMVTMVMEGDGGEVSRSICQRTVDFFDFMEKQNHPFVGYHCWAIS